MTNISSMNNIMNDTNVAAQVARFVDRLVADKPDATLKQDIQNFGVNKLQMLLDALTKRTEELTIRLSQSLGEDKTFKSSEELSNSQVVKSTQDFLKTQCQVVTPSSPLSVEEETISKPSNLTIDFEQPRVQVSKPKMRKL